jgi:hypothetical protein
MNNENIRHHSESHAVDIEIRSRQIADDLHVYRRDETTTIKRSGRKDQVEKASSEGFVDDKNLKRLSANVKFTTLSRNKVVVIPQDWREAYSTGAGSEGDIIWRMGVPKGSGLGDYRKIHEGLYEKFASGLLGKEDVFRVVEELFPYRSWEDGRILVPSLRGSYMEGHFDDAHYDLDKAIAHLSQHPRVRPAKVERSYVRQPAEPKLQRHPIPYYAAERLRSYDLNFDWTPTQEEAVAIVEHVSQSRGKMRCSAWQATFDLDLLGLRAAGAALYQDYSGSREYDPAFSAFDEDEEDHDNENGSFGFR